eukprot:5817925-Prymnesium_polylepis.1
MLESLRRLLPPIRQASPIVEEHFDDEHFDEVPRTRLIGFSGDAKHRSPKSVDRASNERSEQGQQVTERHGACPRARPGRFAAFVPTRQ